MKNVVSVFKEKGYIDGSLMIDEMSRRSHLPKFICKRIYVAEESVLRDCGLLNESGKQGGYFEKECWN